MIKAFHIDCELDYDVAQQTLFVFNLAVASTPTQRIIAETISTSCNATMDEFHDEAGHNRFFRLDVAPGQLNIRYLEKVEVETPELNTFAQETPLAKYIAISGQPSAPDQWSPGVSLRESI